MDAGVNCVSASVIGNTALNIIELFFFTGLFSTSRNR